MPTYRTAKLKYFSIFLVASFVLQAMTPIAVYAVAPRINEPGNVLDDAAEATYSSFDLVHDVEYQYVSSVTPLGDVNGDTIPDWGYSQSNASVGALDQAGLAGVIFGGDPPGQGISVADSLDASYFGASAGARAADKITKLGDINGDGYDDIAVGSYDVEAYTGNVPVPPVDRPEFSDADYNSTGAEGTSLSVSHEVTGEDRFLLVAVHSRLDNSQSVTGVSFDSEPLDFLCEADEDGYAVSLWYMVNPPETTANATATWDINTPDRIVAAMSFTGVDQDNPIYGDNCEGGTGWDTSFSISVPSSTSTLVAGAVSNYTGDENYNLFPGDGMVEIYDTGEFDSDNVIGAGAYKNGQSGSTTMDWENNQTNWPWGGGAVSLLGVGGAPSGGGEDSVEFVHSDYILDPTTTDTLTLEEYFIDNEDSLLVVTVTWADNDSGQFVDSVIYTDNDSIFESLEYGCDVNSAGQKAGIWYLFDPPVLGDADIIVDWNANVDGKVVGAMTFENVNTDTPVRSTDCDGDPSFSGSSGTYTEVLPMDTNPGDIVAGAAGAYNDGLTFTLDGGTELWDTFGGNHGGAGGYMFAGAGLSTDFSWTMTRDWPWTIAAISIIPAGGSMEPQVPYLPTTFYLPNFNESYNFSSEETSWGEFEVEHELNTASIVIYMDIHFDDNPEELDVWLMPPDGAFSEDAGTPTALCYSTNLFDNAFMFPPNQTVSTDLHADDCNQFGSSPSSPNFTMQSYKVDTSTIGTWRLYITDSFGDGGITLSNVSIDFEEGLRTVGKTYHLIDFDDNEFYDEGEEEWVTLGYTDSFEDFGWYEFEVTREEDMSEVNVTFEICFPSAGGSGTAEDVQMRLVSPEETSATVFPEGEFFGYNPGSCDEVEFDLFDEYEFDLSAIGTWKIHLLDSSGDSRAQVYDVRIEFINSDEPTPPGSGPPPGGGVGAGKIWIFMGRESGWQLNAILNDVNADASLVGETPFADFGRWVAPVGDINDDGYDDFIVASPNRMGGRVYLYMGKEDGWEVNQDSYDAADAIFTGEVSYEVDVEGRTGDLGWWSRGVGDVNGDGYDDFILLAPTQWALQYADNKAYLYLGSAEGFSGEIEANDSTADGTFVGSYEDSRLGGQTGVYSSELVALGDINNDGFDDFAFTDLEEYESELEPVVRIVLGHDSSWPSSATGGDAADVTINGFAGAAGIAIGHNIGNINGSDYDDIVIVQSSWLNDPEDSDLIYIIEGKASGWSGTLDVATEAISVIESERSLTPWVQGIGDIDGEPAVDGNYYPDVLLAGNGDSSSDLVIYMLYGGPNMHKLTNLGSGLRVETVLGTRNISPEGEDYAAQETVRVIDDNTNLVISELEADFYTEHRDWTNVTGEADLSLGKSVIANLTDAPGADSEHTLFVPKLPDHTEVRICPNAESLSQVTQSCPEGYVLSAEDENVSIVEINGQDYWRIEGMTGTGGVGVGLTTGLDFQLSPNYGPSDDTIEVLVTYVASDEFEDGDTIAIDFDTGGSFTLGNCSSPTTDADGDTDGDGSGAGVNNGGPNDDRFLYTFSSSTTQASTNGIELCIAVTTPVDAGNYQVDLYDSHGGYSSGLFYVGSENGVNVTAYVDTVFTLSLRNASDTADLPNVGGLPVGPNMCDLGNLSDSGVQTCSYRIKVSTNAENGYTVNIITDGSLRNMTETGFIANVAENSTVTEGTEGYGIALIGGQCTGGEITEEGDFDDDDTPIAVGVLTGIDEPLYSCDGGNNPGMTDLTNTALVTHRAEAGLSTPAGTYTHLVTYTVTFSF